MEKQEEKEILNSFLAIGNRISKRRRIKVCPRYYHIALRQLLRDLDIDLKHFRRAH